MLQIENGILFEIEPRERAGPITRPGNMTRNGRVVLDIDNHPVTDWPDLPATISSMIEGGRMEAMTRLNPRLTQKDFRARMPPMTVLKSGRSKALCGLSALGQKTGRFRKAMGIVAWKVRDGSEAIRSYVVNKLSTQDRQAGTTAGLGELSKEEQEEACEPNRGRFLSRAGTRLLSPSARQARMQKTTASTANQQPYSEEDSYYEEDLEEDETVLPSTYRPQTFTSSYHPQAPPSTPSSSPRDYGTRANKRKRNSDDSEDEEALPSPSTTKRARVEETDDDVPMTPALRVTRQERAPKSSAPCRSLRKTPKKG